MTQEINSTRNNTFEPLIARDGGLVADVFFGQISRFLCIEDISNILIVDPRLKRVLKRIFQEDCSLPNHYSLPNQWFYNTVVCNMTFPNPSPSQVDIPSLTYMLKHFPNIVEVPHSDLKIAMLTCLSNSSARTAQTLPIIIKAAEVGDLTTIEAVIKAIEVENNKNPISITDLFSGNFDQALIGAVWNGHKEIVKQFSQGVLAGGVTIRGFDKALEVAVRQDHREVVELLLQTTFAGGITVTAKGLDKALEVAIGNNHRELIELLLKTTLAGGITVTAKKLDEALIEAGVSGRREVVELLLQPTLAGGITITTEDFDEALSRPNSDVELLLQIALAAGITVTANELNQALAAHAIRGDKGVVELLLQTTLAGGITITAEGLDWTLRGAARDCHIGIVELLLRTTLAGGITVTAEGLNQALNQAAARGDRREIVKLLQRALPYFS